VVITATINKHMTCGQIVKLACKVFLHACLFHMTPDVQCMLGPGADCSHAVQLLISKVAAIMCKLMPAAWRFALSSFCCNRRVQGLDATAARTFYSLRSALERLGVELVLTHLPTTR